MVIALKQIHHLILKDIQDYFLELAPDAPGSIQNQHVRTWFTEEPHPFFNIVLDTHLSEKNVQEWISMILFQAKAKRFPLSWWVNPFTSPPSLREKLKANGFSLVGKFPAMAKSLKNDTLFESDIIRFRQIKKRIEANPWGDVISGAFALSPPVCQKYIDFAFKDDELGKKRFEHYLGFVKEKPVTTGSLFFDQSNGIAGIFNIATNTETRNLGYATQMLQFLIGRAKVLGFETAVLWCAPNFENLASKVGLQKYFVISLYVHS